ncbi:MAG: hypothetical protein OXI44_11160 [Bacteroidota bacterium]|nr:hypothetical protein [Bacteroidota bacterium]
MNNLQSKFFYNSALLLILVFLAIGCSEEAFVEESNEDFVGQLRDLVLVHMDPDKENVFLLMGIVGSEIRQHSIKSGVVDKIDYVFAEDHPDIAKFGFDVMISPEDAFKTLGINVDKCSILLSKPVNRDNANAWTDYGGCVSNLVKECRTVFSHVDDERNWITHCHDYRGQLPKEELDLI